MIKILVAEDEPLTRLALIDYLQKKCGASALIEGVANGHEAVERCAMLHPQLVLMDIEMPVLDGLEAAAVIHRSDPAVKIVFLTAFDRFDYAVGALRAGGSEYLLKPFDPAQLDAYLQRIFPMQPASPEPAAPQTPFANRFSVWIEYHYHENISLEQAAESMGISSFYFSRLFRTTYQQSFLEYLTAYRMKRAQKMLRETDLPIRAIALRTGYSDANYFTKVFKCQLGQTPSEYRMSRPD